jgi:Putative prokaryotic signal transducing protein
VHYLRAMDEHDPSRRIDRRYAEGEPVRVAGAMNQAEAEFIQGLLLEEGIPSMLRRTRGFDVPDMLAAGPREIMVPEAGYVAAREVLLQAEILSDEPAAEPPRARWLNRLLELMRIRPRS